MLHTHLLGTAIRVRHFRDGIELKPLDQDNSYDFNFQETRLLPEEVTIKKVGYTQNIGPSLCAVKGECVESVHSMALFISVWVIGLYLCMGYMT